MRTNNHRICPLPNASETQPNVTHGAAVTVRKEKGGVFSIVICFRLSFLKGNHILLHLYQSWIKDYKPLFEKHI